MSTDHDNEELRLRKLYQYELLDTPRDESFDRITRLVTAVLDVPIAAVTLVDRDRQWFKSQQGLDVDETPRELSFCAHAMAAGAPMIVPDAQRDPRFSQNPLVTGHPDIRFYVGVPLQAADGTPLGALCAIDTQPREIEPHQLQILSELADLTMEQLELRLAATQDGLTGAMRRKPFLECAGRDVALAQRSGAPLACLMIDADNFKTYNDYWGHATGDQVLLQLAAAIRRELRRTDSLGRMGGEEFCVLLPDTDLDGALTAAERIRTSIAAVSVDTVDGPIGVTASIGAAELRPTDDAPEDLIQRADAALYEAKHAGRNRVAA